MKLKRLFFSVCAMCFLLISCSSVKTKSSEKVMEEKIASDTSQRIELEDVSDYIQSQIIENEVIEDDIAETEQFDKKIVVIDAGHQMHANTELEPIGPGSNDTKPKVSAGTKGYQSGIPEYEINLILSNYLQAELIERGYTVIMCRTENDVNISNIERAQIANDADADVFVRIHCNGSNNHSLSGAMTICQTANNPYNSYIYSQSKLLSECILDALVEYTGCNKEYVWETDSMSGINWSNVPVTIVEVGYMTNEIEEELLLSEDYQEKIVQGIANGIDAYFSRCSNNP